ncbi:Sucraseferredoxin-like protein [Rhypophila decipiens]|uniref:Altered inheritance of mitochondria protein 32 n=1 Tax=Rhypophila decipiens TaxID=261697 RepID=A0AAN6YJ05_9PEZI|nr:Sucraseferredoxin-like protein [Rhypophila decipiens]
MTLMRHFTRGARPLLAQPQRSFASKSSPPPFPTIASCPSPTCACAPTPSLPDDFPIDHKTNINGLISNYAQHVLVCTGKDDWPSRIEEDNSGDNLAADLKELVGRGGPFSDPFHNISVLNTSLPSSIPPRSEVQTTSVYLLPDFKYVPFLPRVSFDSVEALVKGFLLPEKLHPMHDGLSPIHRDRLTRKPAYQSMLYGVRDVEDIMVLICGHGGRDQRCGVYGPVLRDEFSTKLSDMGINVLSGPVEVNEKAEAVPEISGEAPATDTTELASPSAHISLISHIGGHKFAGNVILYIPPQLKTADGKAHPLAGHGIWYGRVEPKHVQGIIGETILKGNVISDLFRGGIKQNGEILRL